MASTEVPDATVLDGHGEETPGGGDEVFKKDPALQEEVVEGGDGGTERCPAQSPIGQSCADEGLRCTYGTECCCGQCYPSLVCECQSGRFACYYTDACLIPGCPDAVDAVDASDSGASDVQGPDELGGEEDAGVIVQCASVPPVFPVFEKSCQSDEDCVLVFHQVNCCGTEVAWGIAASEKAAFDAAEKECRAQFPPCGCPAFPTEAEDGNIPKDPDQIAVRCKAGTCFSYVKGMTPRCHDGNDCEPSQICLAPGEQPPCGICRKPEDECQKDADCAPTEVCEWVSGACLCWPAMQCVMRCDLPVGGPLGPCKPGQACVNGHCVAKACKSDEDCPPFFQCVVASQTCERRTCQADGDCLGGRCVKGACYDSLGTCSYIPP